MWQHHISPSEHRDFSKLDERPRNRSTKAIRHLMDISSIMPSSWDLFKLGLVDGIKRLSRALKPLSEEPDAEAAVALLLKPVDQDLRFLIVKRAESPVDPWSGQMAFPGGKRDVKDRGLKYTVARETLEETNIDLLDRCRFLGLMETMRSTERPEMKVLPFVFLLEHEPRIRLNEELEEFAWISLEELAQHRGTIKFGFGEVPAYIIGKRAIWGLTYGILERVFQILEDSH